MRSKYKEGQPVVVKPDNRRTPKYIMGAIRKDRKRTITAVVYDEKSEHNRYYVGSNRMGADLTAYPFRSDELQKALQKRSKGRIKRQYHKKVSNYHRGGQPPRI